MSGKIEKMLFLWVVFFAVSTGLMLMLPGFARAEMENNLSNAGCKTCHLDYPGIKGPPYPDVFKHKITNCTQCHIGGPYIEKMWNCRYCHLATYNDTYPLSLGGYPDWTGTVSGFKSWRDPLRGAPLGSKIRWLGAHFTGGSSVYLPPNSWPVDAGFTYHNNSTGFKHTAALPEAGCLSCHKDTLTSEHEGKTSLVNNPVEDFEDGAFAFNFTGYWGGDWSRTNETAYSGVYAYKSGLIGLGLRDGPYSTAVTETTVNAAAAGTVSFWYKVSGAGTQLLFYIDGTEQLNGTAVVWTKVSYPLTAGLHTLKWVTGGNSAYIDDISVLNASTTYTVDCNTCHLSSDANVKSAIANHITTCSACHTGSEHETVHTTTLLDAKCTTCHINSLTQEHQNNPITQKQALNCDSCHQNPDLTISAAIAVNNKQCAACHRQSHNMNMLEGVYPDIPLYSGYVWSAPQEARTWAGESWMPEEFLAAGKVIISNRRTDVTGDAVWSFYQTELTAKGWSLLTSVPAAGSDYYSATFTKGIRKIVLWFYGGEGHTPSPVPAAGYRVEILYK